MLVDSGVCYIYIRQSQQRFIVQSYLYIQRVTATAAIIRYRHKNKQRKLICCYINNTYIMNESSFLQKCLSFYRHEFCQCNSPETFVMTLKLCKIVLNFSIKIEGSTHFQIGSFFMLLNNLHFEHA
jgi:hypothetical protein